ncbi:hypothetical protein EHQ58_08470 [Leptospira ognonensis]|uniref:Uncharacterized protein n=1 Tax=Leptospira ognonensis TaxID=2484945 RepID=A0A4V3JRF2_9LEPT|nr:hypothetical protein [Leptospira ognonensis]TGL59765.1 hypothetical protein EHQ58_08470 [Leptospira ognonensis]
MLENNIFENKKLLAIIDSPINALMLSQVLESNFELHIIYVFDPKRKNVTEYMETMKLILSGIPIASERLIEIDSDKFWEGRVKESVDHGFLVDLKKANIDSFTIIGNYKNNPVAKILFEMTEMIFLYHSANELQEIADDKLSFKLKTFIKRILNGKLKLAALFKKQIIISPIRIQFPSLKTIHVDLVKAQYGIQFDRKLPEKGDFVHIMLLITGDEPVHPGDANPSNFLKYLEAHVRSVQLVLRSENLKAQIRVFVKEHKSYLPLTKEERGALTKDLREIGCEVIFVNDILPKTLRVIPGEMLLSFLKIDILTGEASAFLLNCAGSSVSCYISVTQFSSFRTKEEEGRTQAFLHINQMLTKPANVI